MRRRTEQQPFTGREPGRHESDHGRNRPKFNLARNILAVIGGATVLYFLITEVLMRLLAWITSLTGGAA